MPPSAAELLMEIYRAAVRGADPGVAVREALAASPFSPDRRLWLLAIGKAAHTMATAAVAALAEQGITIAGGVVVGAHAEVSPHAELEMATGEHPLPGMQSLKAAERIGTIVTRVRPEDDVLVLLSGGGTSLAGAPIDGVSSDDLLALNVMLLGSGADIMVMNGVRKRFSRWAAGRLARALAPARVRCLIVSDVHGDDPTFIASGPCSPDPLYAADLRALLAEYDMEKKLPAAVRVALADMIAGRRRETPKPGDPMFANVTQKVILGNAQALQAAAARATSLGVRPVFVSREALLSSASVAGAKVARELMQFADSGLRRANDPAAYACMLWGGETTVVLEDGAHGMGGRCQELALSAARALHAAGANAHGVAVLAAGTDGRDGPTDAAGAIVDGATWAALAKAGRDPARDLTGHDAFPAFEAIGALVRTGHSGTNVRDVVIGLVQPR
jgi:hydroxypyruvate reductase